MNVLGLLGDAALGGAEGYVKSRYQELDDEARDLRTQGLKRLDSLLRRDEINLRDVNMANRQADRRDWDDQRDEKNWNRQYSQYVNPKTGAAYTNAEISGGIPDGAVSAARYNQMMKPASKDIGFSEFQKLSPEQKAEYSRYKGLGRGGNGAAAIAKELKILKDAGKPISFTDLSDMVQADPEYAKSLADIEKKRTGSGWNPFDNKSEQELPDPDPLKWAQTHRPDLFASAVFGEQAIQSLMGGGGNNKPATTGKQDKKAAKGEGTGKKKIKSDAGLRIVLSKIQSLPQDQQAAALEEAKKTFDAESYQKIEDALTGNEWTDKALRAAEGFRFDLGDVARVMTQGGVNAVKGGYGLLGQAGDALGGSYGLIMDANNRLGNNIVGGAKVLGNYTKDRIKEDWFGDK